MQPGILSKISPLERFQYVRRNIYLVSTAELDRLPPGEQAKLTIRDDLNLIRLRDRFFDTTIPQPKIPVSLRLVPTEAKQLHLVQFVAAIQDNWLASLLRIKGIQVVSYLPENAYLVWAGSEARKSLADWADFQKCAQWHGPYHPAYKIHPAFDLKFDGDVTATIQLVTSTGVAESLAKIKAKASEVLRDTYRVGPYTNILVKMPASELGNVARLEDVVNVEPWVEPELGGERQGQVLANQLNAAGSQPSGPGYLGWLNARGFNATFDFVVDVADTGIDRGQTTAANLHQDFLDAGGNSRVEYVQRVSGTTIDTTAANNNDTGGHGTLDAAIVGGFNDTAATAADFAYYGDGDGYRYGLGVAPYVRLGSSRIFDPAGFTSPDYTELINAAYGHGARINSNSWGDTTADGSYDTASLEYDGLVRDAQPSSASDGGETGNQEMCIVFLAGNSGSGASTLWNMGSTAKNTITVGACENFNATGDQDGSGIGDAGANDVRDIISFSSRGPCDGPNGRVKPDIMASGTHVFGAASQDPSFAGSSVSGGPTNDFVAPPDDAYYPPDPDTTDTQDQDLYTWSSGTSHSCPAVAGGAALLRQWFINEGLPAPSPAMTKAYLMNSATYMTGVGANDDLPSNNQGMGRMNLEMTFDNTPRLLFDQVKTCHATATVDPNEVFTVAGTVSDSTEPFRVTLAWTDTPGATVAGPALKNDLDLEIQVGGNFYRGNDFTGATSNIGAVADPSDELNNVESVFLPAGTTGNFTVTVRPTDINSDGVPNNGDTTDQDFALVIHNGEFPARNPVDIILVLDHSGSMNSVAPGGTKKKIDLLKDAVEMFIRTWIPFSIPEDRMGIVYFESAVTKYPNTPVVLLPFQTNAQNFIDNVRAIGPMNWTALGGGILTAYRGFDGAAGHQEHIIVFTNGMQNCSPMVQLVGSAHQILADPSAIGGDSGVPEEPGVNLADYGLKAIHTICTGTSASTWTTLLTDIASETGGTNHLTTAPDENLEDYFLDTLVAALRVDPVEKVKTVSGMIGRTDPPKEELFALNSSVRKATFALSWRGERRIGALTFDLVGPDGTVIPASLQTIQNGLFYRIASVGFPLQVHGNQIDPAGNWKLVIKSHLEVDEVSYRAHLIVDDAELRYHFDVPAIGYGVGEVIPLSFWAQHGNRTITGLTGEVTATIARPPVGFGTFMSKHQVSKAELARPIDLSGDGFANLVEKKGFILMRDDALREELYPVIDRISLYDDGKPEHGDAKANDGVYSALYKNTTRPGLYDVHLSATGRDPELGTIARSESRTVSIGMKHFDLGRSTLYAEKVGPATYEVRIILIDHFGNYLGPGHSLEVVIAPPGSKWGPIGRRLPLKDNLDGSYSGRVQLTQAEEQDGAELVIDVDGNRIAKVPKTERPPIRRRRFSFSVHAGGAIPVGPFNNSYDPSYHFAIDVDYHFTPQLSLVGTLGLSHFDGKPGFSSTDWWNLSANLKYEFTTDPVRPYVNLGPGLYWDSSTNFGFNAGLGLDFSLNPAWSVELGADYHHIFTSGSDTQYVVPHIGLIHRF